MMTNIRILVVEDEEYIQADLYGPLAEDSRNQLHFVSNEGDAIRALNSINFDVAFVDIHLRAKDLRNFGGIEVIRHIHALKEGTSVIAVSGTPSTDAMHQTYESQVDGFLLKKKVRTQDLLATLDKLREVRSAGSIPRFGHFADVIGLLSYPERDPAIWDRNLSDFLGSSVPIVRDMLNDVTRDFLPVLRLKTPLSEDGRSHEGRSWSETLWSKALGRPIRLVLTTSSVATDMPRRRKVAVHDENVLLTRNNRGLECIVYTVGEELPRVMFDDSIWTREPVRPSSNFGAPLP